MEETGRKDCYPAVRTGLKSENEEKKSEWEAHEERSIAMNEKSVPQSIDEYISAYPAEVQEILQELRKVIHEEAPEVVETISYNIPTFDYQGHLVFFAAYKNFISLYPAPRTAEPFREELAAYKGAVGTVQFPLNKPIPYDLVRRIVRYLREEKMRQFGHPE